MDKIGQTDGTGKRFIVKRDGRVKQLFGMTIIMTPRYNLGLYAAIE